MEKGSLPQRRGDAEIYKNMKLQIDSDKFRFDFCANIKSFSATLRFNFTFSFCDVCTIADGGKG